MLPVPSWCGRWAFRYLVICNINHIRMPATASSSIDSCLLHQTLLRSPVFVVQVSMWSLQKKPEFKQKFPELVDEPQQPEVSPCHATDVVYKSSTLTSMLTG